MLRDVILTQKAELEKTLNETYVERNIEAFSLEHNLTKVVMGPRRAGKSFFCLHTLSKQEKFGYLNFDKTENSRKRSSCSVESGESVGLQ